MSKEFIDAEMELFRQQCAECDIVFGRKVQRLRDRAYIYSLHFLTLAQKIPAFEVITTALIPGRPAPKLLTKDTLCWCGRGW